MLCPLCSHDIPAGETHTCKGRQRRMGAAPDSNDFYQNERSRREQALCNWALETGWTGTMAEWSSLLNRADGNIPGT